MSDRHNLTPDTSAALYARVSSARQDVDSASPPICGTGTIMERLCTRELEKSACECQNVHPEKVQALERPR